MKNQYLVLLLMPVLMNTGCKKEKTNGEDIICTMQAVSGLNVNVRLQNGTNLQTKDITVIARDGAYTEVLVGYSLLNEPYFSGAIERKGNYVITVTKTGYKTFTSNTISVLADSCHVIPQVVNVVLQPQ
ncbi:MAG: hypothetical protein EAZ51_04700 [Sphingobacteriales bacterium]|nr:MAG: hypothetical protein EAZ64_04540 [Sphingobacteriales bacterium]TAF81142.1 MAG: hypothetical protein EAZ51_04700 [Sphingobacteriales bacterium]